MAVAAFFASCIKFCVPHSCLVIQKHFVVSIAQKYPYVVCKESEKKIKIKKNYNDDDDDDGN